MSLSGGQLAGGNSTSTKAEHDFYATDPKTVELFLNRFIADGNDIGGTIWECACGSGNISEVLKQFYPEKAQSIVSSDIVYRGYGSTKPSDFLTSPFRADTIITNPPFSQINEFIRHGLQAANKYLIFFAKIQTLETVERMKLLQESPLKYVYVHSKRQATWKNNAPLDPNGNKWATTMCLAWFVWEIGYKGEPVIRFL